MIKYFFSLAILLAVSTNTSAISKADLYQGFRKNFPALSQGCGAYRPTQNAPTLFFTDKSDDFYAYHDDILTYNKYYNNHIKLVWCASFQDSGKNKAESDNTFINYYGSRRFRKVVGKLPKYKGYLKMYYTAAQQAFVGCVNPSGKLLFTKVVKSEMGLSDPVFVDFKCPQRK